MEKLHFKFLSVFMALAMLVAQTHSLSAKPLDMGVPSVDESVFSLDETALDAAFAGLDELDQYLDVNQGTTFSELKESGSELVAGLSDMAAPMGAAASGDIPLGIPAFWWGCILGWVGILLIYIFTDNDKEAVKKSFYGCLVGTLLGVGIYVVALGGDGI